ncbi:hypothetical protein EC991_002396 [Linnemannia zychae]|nr:hypothetical protein EC991_002396 [Linnemannia zychae]
MVIECLPLILITTVYELDILRYLFFGYSTRPIPPSRRKLDSISFLPIPEKVLSWQGRLVAFVCGLVWFFSEFTLDIILIVLGVDSAADHGGVGQNWRREWQREGEGAYDGTEGEGDFVVEQLDLQNDMLTWNSKERSIEFEQECEALFAVSVAFGAAEDEEGAVLSITVPTVDMEKDIQMQDRNALHSGADFNLLPAQDPECKGSPTIDAPTDEDIDTEAADESASASSSPLSSSSTSRTNLHSVTKLNVYRNQEEVQDGFTDNATAWAQRSVSTKAAEAPTLNDCQTTADVHYFHHSPQLQQGDDPVSEVSVRAQVSEEQSQDQWPDWAPGHLSRAVKTVRSTQQQQQEQRAVTSSPTGGRYLALFLPLSPLAAVESNVETLSDDERSKGAKKRALRYSKKKKAAKKARKASGMPLPGSDSAGSCGEVDRLAA